jgi:hypothetical protein
LWYDISADRIHGARCKGPQAAASLEEIAIPTERARHWRVEADFVDAIRAGTPIQFTDFPTGVQYMEFTEAVARSAQLGEPVELPLAEFEESEA